MGIDLSPTSPQEEGKALDPRVVRTRRVVLTAGRELLLEEGWDALTHAKLAERAGVGRATLYRHWPTSVSLLRDVLSDIAVMRVVARTGALRTDLIEELESIRLQLSEPGLGHVVATLVERSEWETDLRELKAQTSEKGTQSVRELLEAATRDGRLHPDLDVDLALARLVGVVFFERFFARRALAAKFIEAIVDCFLAESVADAVTGAP